jgi:hypothetical protein
MVGKTLSEISFIATDRPVAASARGMTIDFNFSLVNIIFKATIPATTRTTGMASITSQIFDLRLIDMVGSWTLCVVKYRQECRGLQLLKEWFFDDFAIDAVRIVIQSQAGGAGNKRSFDETGGQKGCE